MGRVQIFRLNFLQIGPVGVQDVTLQLEMGEFTLATNGDQASGFEFLHVVGERGGADRLAPTNLGAGYATFRSADLLQDFVASRIGQGLRYQMNLAFRKRFPFRHGCLHIAPQTTRRHFDDDRNVSRDQPDREIIGVEPG